jgi:plastocyanin
MVANRFPVMRLVRSAAGVGLLLAVASSGRASQPVASAAKGKHDAAQRSNAWGSLRGKIVFRGTVPALPPLVRKGDPKATDAKVCAAHDVPDESLVVDPKLRGVRNVFVYLRRKPAKMHPDLSRPPAKGIVFDQKHCRFLPHALAVRVGQPVLLKSSDSVLHNTNIVGHKNVLLAAGGGPESFTFKEPSLVPVPVQCNFHPWMKAWMMAFDHPYFAVTGKTGEFRIEKLPPGKMQFRFWQERAGYVNSADGKLKKGILEVTIQPGKTTEVTIALDAKSLQLDKKAN